MNWGLYEIPNTTKMRITILASSPTQPQAEENETQDVKNILVLRNAFEKTRKQMKVNALSINALSDNLNFPMFAKLTLKKT